MNYCPIEKMIPIYLVVTGAVYLVVNALNYDLSKSMDNHKVIWCNTIFFLFTFGWFIAGNVWIFR